ncbi:MAG: PHB depolymerase family esterase [Pseudomonadota bacterium]
MLKFMKNTIRLIMAMAIGLTLAAPVTFAQQDIFIDFGRGPEAVHLPPQIESEEPLPLVMMLHGYGSSALLTDIYLGFTAEADRRGFILIKPNGRVDVFGNRFWNATPACCQYFGESNDSAYLRRVIDTLAQRFAIDEGRIYVTGHSNGGFMSHRMACDHADRIAAIAGIAGATWADPGANCTPSEPVAALQIHGTADFTILYNGGCLAGLGCYPSARFSAYSWAVLNGCDLVPDTAEEQRDFTTGGAGEETTLQAYPNCDAGGAAALWTLTAGGHVPAFTSEFLPAMVDFLYSHEKAQ